MRWFTYKIPILILALLISAAPVLISMQAESAPLTSRQVRLGSSVAGAATSHNFSFVIPASANLGSVQFEYCDNDPFIGAPCNAPAGLSLSAANLISQTGETGFSIHPLSTANRLILTRPASPNLAFQPVTYDFSNIINPSANQSVYVRISTYSSMDATGPVTDSGAVVFATASNISVEGYIPPYLAFCVGITVGAKCSNATGSFISLGELSKSAPRFATSQFSGATNDPGGYSTFMAGTTMTSGNNTIPAMSSTQPSSSGASQFGLNLVGNSNPSVGQNPTGPGTLSPVSGFGNSNQFKFANEVVAASSIPSDYNIITVSYIVNVSASQPPGVYSTTITYIAAAAF